MQGKNNTDYYIQVLVLESKHTYLHMNNSKLNLFTLTKSTFHTFAFEMFSISAQKSIIPLLLIDDR